MAESNRTESATPKKLKDAREKGEVARSMEISASVNMFVGLSVVAGSMMFIFHQIRSLIGYTFNQFAMVPLSFTTMVEIMRHTVMQLFITTVPVLLIITIAVIMVNYLQTGFKITPEAIRPKLSKLNPINGIKKLFNLRALIELLKSTIKITFVILIVWAVIKARLPESLLMLDASFQANLQETGNIIWEVIWKLGLFFLLVGVLDYAYQVYDFKKRQRMTKQEVRDEFKQQEGDGQIKSKRKSKHRKMMMTRIAAEVARADVVTTNPTHYAVALRYDQKKMRAPKVVAKGENNWAKIIRRIALKHHVPVIENKPVTRAIYHSVEIGQEIPPMLYKAVAEILAALFKLKAGKGRSR